MPKVSIIRKPSGIVKVKPVVPASKTAQAKLKPSAPIRQEGGRPVVTRPEVFYSILAKDANSYQPGIADKSRWDFFTLTPDPEKQYGNYGKAYIEMPANIQGIKIEFYPTNPQQTEGTDTYREAINHISEGVVTLYVNDQPVGYWRVDDIAHSYDVDPFYSGASTLVNLILNDQPFTIMKDLLASKVVKTRGRDRIYVSIQTSSALADENVPEDFKIKCSLLIRPERVLFV
jgi:hypothetical protein